MNILQDCSSVIIGVNMINLHTLAVVMNMLD